MSGQHIGLPSSQYRKVLIGRMSETAVEVEDLPNSIAFKFSHSLDPNRSCRTIEEGGNRGRQRERFGSALSRRLQPGAVVRRRCVPLRPLKI